MESSVQKMRALFLTHGLRVTLLRVNIYQAIQLHGNCDEKLVHDQLKVQGFEICYASIRRVIKTLVDAGLISSK